ncbi:hypothetical protein BJ875DRAFT_149015 [Amylocarpus encephaloides]|uniref:Alternative oxidase n=1 Tax=Amylocarpus encephaloides TaxID=45428 RepID=A0A9P7YPW4_9HELO|nr:hypothetical protein BJ875DRAFT_149015 [Amylocarpus encephaloides]
MAIIQKPTILTLLAAFVFASTACLYLFWFGRPDIPDIELSAISGFSKIVPNEAFIQQWLASEIDGDLNLKPLGELCTRSNWTEGLIASCGSPQGGVGNVRNVFLNCVRFAIEAGATGFVIPRIRIRDEKDLTKLTTGNTLSFEYMFDRYHFHDALRRTCPRMITLDSVPKGLVPITVDTQDILKEGYEVDPEDITLLAEPSKWRGKFDTWLTNQNVHLNTTTSILIDLRTPLLRWPMAHDGPKFMQTFGRILRFPPDIRRLAATTTYTLSQKYLPKFSPGSGIPPDGYLGAHLRTAEDAIKAGWPSYEIQSAGYIAQAHAHNLSIIYVTSGSKDDMARFKADAFASHKLTTVTKQELLEGKDLEHLNSLTWDQQGLVDYEMLLRSSSFGGIDGSSFAWNIALRRHILSEEGRAVGGEGMGLEGFLAGERGVSSVRDEFSDLRGEPGRNRFFGKGLWP